VISLHRNGRDRVFLVPLLVKRPRGSHQSLDTPEAYNNSIVVSRLAIDMDHEGAGTREGLSGLGWIVQGDGEQQHGRSFSSAWLCIEECKTSMSGEDAMIRITHLRLEHEKH